jgi:DNA repair ATPase RecN
MTTEISIKNFQSAKDVSLVVDGFTVVVGQNNIGKSAIIRAVDAALINRTGDGFIRDDEKNTEIKIKREGFTLEWKKGAKASYKINDTESFTALNRDIPQPLIDAGFGRMEIGDKKVSPLIAHQFEPLFLINKGGSVVTEVLAGIYDLDSLSIADDMCQKDLKAQKSMLKTREGDLKGLQGKLEVYTNFESIKEEVKALVEKDKACQDLQAEIALLSDYSDQLIALSASLEVLKGIKGVKVPDTSECEKLVEENSWLDEKIQELFVLGTNIKKFKIVQDINIPSAEGFDSLTQDVTQLSEWSDQLEISQRSVAEYEKVLNLLNPGILELEKLIPKASDALNSFTEISDFEQNFISTVTSTKATRDELKKVTEELEIKNKELSEIKVCPLCERPY